MASLVDGSMLRTLLDDLVDSAPDPSREDFREVVVKRFDEMFGIQRDPNVMRSCPVGLLRAQYSLILC